MKKIITLMLAVIVCCSMIAIPASAAVPTSLTIKETKTAPNVSDKGVIDAAYGSPIFDYRATDLTVGDNNLFPRTPEECAQVQDAINVMRNVGYATYDNKYFYMACVLTDLAPKASPNSAAPWQSTGIQLLLFVNTERSWTTFAYEGTNKVGVFDDNKGRSVLDPEYVTATFYERSQTEYVLEFKIAWEGFPEIDSLADVQELKMGVVQTSMADTTVDTTIKADGAYTCSAFGDAYDLKYEKALPVTMVSANGGSSNNNNGGGSSTTTSTITSTITTPAESDTTSAPSDGTAVDIGGDSSDTTSTEDTNSGDGDGEGDTTVVTVEGERDWTPIIIIAIIAVVLIIGGAVAIILLNKKPKTDSEN